MKKLLFLLLSCAFFSVSFSQPFPINSTIGTQKSTVLTKGIHAVDSAFWLRTNFPDTGTANLGQIDEIPGALIRVQDKIYMRSWDALKWVEFTGSGGSTYTASNGITLSGSDFKLGGSLTGNTTITNASGHLFMLYLDEDDDETGLLGNNYGGLIGFKNGEMVARVNNSGLKSNLSSLLFSENKPHGSYVEVFTDSIKMQPRLGKLLIDTLTNVPGTKSLRYNPSTGLVSYSDTTIGGGSYADSLRRVGLAVQMRKNGNWITQFNLPDTGNNTTVPGAYNNLLINRNGQLAAIGDSLKITSQGWLQALGGMDVPTTNHGYFYSRISSYGKYPEFEINSIDTAEGFGSARMIVNPEEGIVLQKYGANKNANFNLSNNSIYIAASGVDHGSYFTVSATDNIVMGTDSLYAVNQNGSNFFLFKHDAGDNSELNLWTGDGNHYHRILASDAELQMYNGNDRSFTISDNGFTTFNNSNSAYFRLEGSGTSTWNVPLGVTDTIAGRNWVRSNIPAPAIPTLQQVLTSGSTLTSANTVNMNGNFFALTNGVKSFIEIDLTPNLEYAEFGASNASTANFSKTLYALSNVDAQFVNRASTQFGEVKIDGDVNATTRHIVYTAAEHKFSNKTGFGMTTPNHPDSTVHIKGGLRIENGTQGAGKVLTSDANGGASWQTPATVADTSYTTLASFTAGGGFASDTTMCTDSTLFGSFYTGQFDYTIAYIQAVIKGNAGDSIVLKLVFNDTFNVDGTKVSGAGLSVNNRYTGNTFTIGTNRVVAANTWLWLKPEAIITGKKPKYISVTLVGYKTYVAP